MPKIKTTTLTIHVLKTFLDKIPTKHLADVKELRVIGKSATQLSDSIPAYNELVEKHAKKAEGFNDRFTKEVGAITDKEERKALAKRMNLEFRQKTVKLSEKIQKEEQKEVEVTLTEVAYQNIRDLLQRCGTQYFNDRAMLLDVCDLFNID